MAALILVMSERDLQLDARISHNIQTITVVDPGGWSRRIECNFMLALPTDDSKYMKIFQVPDEKVEAKGAEAKR
jgi:hypothetical protein